MAIGDPRLGPALLVGPGEPAGVGDLEPDQQVIGPAMGLEVGPEELLAEPDQIGQVGLVDQELIGVGPPVVADGHGLAAPDQLGAAPAEVPPSLAGQAGGAAILGAVPALHRQDREPVADRPGPGLARASERGVGPGLQLEVDRQVDAERTRVVSKVVDGLDRGHPSGRHRSVLPDDAEASADIA